LSELERIYHPPSAESSGATFLVDVSSAVSRLHFCDHWIAAALVSCAGGDVALFSAVVVGMDAVGLGRPST
jgi:hypothetical protein